MSVEKKFFKNGMTVRDLKEAIKNWPDDNKYTGEPCEVWLDTGSGLSNQAKAIMPLNYRNDDEDGISADFLLGAR